MNSNCDKKFNVVYFCSMILDWKFVCKTNADTLYKSGILNDKNCRSFTIVFTGEQKLIKELKQIFKNDKIIFKYKGNDIKSHEYHGIYEIKQLAKLYKNDRLLYYHSKGVTRKRAAVDWVEYLEYFNILNYKKCLEKLDVCDVVGTEYLCKPKHHMSGNFWWVTANHIIGLKVPSIYSKRHNFEWFILNTKKPTSIWNFHNSIDTTISMYNGKRREDKYHDINQGSIIKINTL